MTKLSDQTTDIPTFQHHLTDMVGQRVMLKSDGCEAFGILKRTGDKTWLVNYHNFHSNNVLYARGLDGNEICLVHGK